jgi:glycosyltransferase involved in cell wall biosynthesis
LKKRFGLPLVLDFRDEWDISQRYLENARQDRLSYIIQSRMQRYILKQADALVCTTQSSARRLQDRAREAGGHAASTCIYNGFDEDDIAPGPAAADIAGPERSVFRLVYTGTLWNLTSIEPLIAAIEVLEASVPERLAQLELVIVGRRTEQQEKLLDRVRKTRCRLRPMSRAGGGAPTRGDPSRLGGRDEALATAPAGAWPRPSRAASARGR